MYINKMNKTTYAAIAAATMAAAGSANAALLAGDTIGLDFGTGTTANNFNAVNYAAVADLNNTGGAATGVSYASTGDGGFAGNDGAHQVVALAGFDGNHLNDWVASYQGADTFEFTLSGLDNSLTYDLTLVVGASNDANVAGTGSNVVSINGVAQPGNTPAQSPTANSVVTLTGLTTNGAGQLIVNHTGGVASGWSAGTITAVPEPSSSALLGLGGLALIMRRRK